MLLNVIKTITLITVDSSWDSIGIKPLIHQGFGSCLHLLVWHLAATVNLEKVLVTTRMFSLLVLPGSTLIKFMHNRSTESFAFLDPCGFLDLCMDL